jgi:thiamine pyrophosphate-dependent acetolactate synthase large subunit-like protein
MKDLIKQYLDQGVSRRNFLSALGGIGVSAAAADAMANSLAPFVPQAPSSEGAPPWMRQMEGTGSALLVAQLKAAGVRHVFCNPSGASGPFFDALVDVPEIQVIKALEEGALGGIADGYAKGSGKPAFAMCDAAGMPAFMGQMFVSWADRIPVVLAIDDDAIPNATNSITKWHWHAESPDALPGIARQALKFASTQPAGPVFLVVDGGALSGQGRGAIMDQEKFNVPMNIRPDRALIDRAARMLIEARNPLLYYGDEITICGAEKELLELAELLGIPAVDPGRQSSWSKPFPTRHPLFQAQIRQTIGGYPGEPDVLINLGNYFRNPLRLSPRTRFIDVRLEPETMGTMPAEIAILADLKLALTDLVAAVRSAATAERLKQLSEPRIARAREHRAQMDETLKAIAARHRARPTLNMTHVITELETVLEKNSCIVENGGSGTEGLCQNYMSMGGADKGYIKQSAIVLGWGVSAAFGVQLARPNNPVVAIVGDGEFMFRGPQPLWSYARYKAPSTVVVINNHSYDNERNRLWQRGGRQFETGRDMICYNGDPDIDFTKLAAGVGVEGEVVAQPASLRQALERAKRANADGRPYLLDMQIERGGVGAPSTWHPGYSISAQRGQQS